jgi:hypothetical protein
LPVECDEGTVPRIETVSPPNATASFDSREPLTVRFACPVDLSLVDDGNARVYGQQLGYQITDYFWSAANDEDLGISFRRVGAFMPGERVTAWVGSELGGPYIWQYTESTWAKTSAQFQVGSQDLSALSSARDVVLADFDGDHQLDVLVGAYQAAMQLWLNDDSGDFEYQGEVATLGTPAVADVDHDGDLDVFGDGPLMLNNGDATFESGPALTGCVAPGDFDGDGDLDCIQSAGYRADSTVYGAVLFNRDGRHFDAGPETAFGFECEVADLDGDADLDVVCVSPVVEGVRFFLNDGKGVFERSPQKLAKVGARGIAIGDVDGDLDVDVAVAVWHGGGKYAANELWLNDGKAKFSDRGNLGGDGGDIELGDLDGDRDLDAIVTELTPYGPNVGPFNRAHIYMNDGQGNFSDSGRTVGDPAYHWLKLGDLDLDGDLDAFVFHQVANADDYSSVWFNQK